MRPASDSAVSISSAYAVNGRAAYSTSASGAAALATVGIVSLVIQPLLVGMHLDSIWRYGLRRGRVDLEGGCAAEVAAVGSQVVRLWTKGLQRCRREQVGEPVIAVAGWILE